MRGRTRGEWLAPVFVGAVLLRDVSLLLWEHFEPEIPWQPAEDVERYW